MQPKSWRTFPSSGFREVCSFALPEKVIKKDPAAKYMELGIAEDWVPVIQKAGYNTVADMQDVNPQKLHQDICGINKKYKLELTNPSVNDVTEWINKLK